MPGITYRDFDLLLERAGDGYRARVLHSPGGQASAEFRLPFSPLELENFQLRITRARDGFRDARRAPGTEALKTFGGRLFETVFDDEVAACLSRSLVEAGRQGAGLRVRLRLADTPELAGLP